MTKTKPTSGTGRPAPRKPPAGRTAAVSVSRGPGGRRFLALGVAAVVVAVVAVLYVVYQGSPHSSPPGAAPGGARFSAGSPGAGQPAPEFSLPAATGGTVSLASLRGKSVLLYFHEGLGCQPCWDQLRDLEKDSAAVTAAGVDEVVAITTGPANLLAQKLHDDGLHTVTLADTDLTVSRQYQANRYGMMGQDRDGHTFILVGPDGQIEWRADYGGAPNYTMYVAPAQLLADLKARAQP